MATLSSSSIDRLRDYLMHKLDLADLHEWLLSVEWDEDADADERNLLASLRGASLESSNDPQDLFDVDVAVITLLKAVASSANWNGGETDFSSGVRKLWYIYAWNGTSIATSNVTLVADDPTTPAMISTTATVPMVA